MPRTFKRCRLQKQRVYRGNIARIYTQNHDTITKDRSFLSLRRSPPPPPLFSHLRPVMFLFMVHDSKLPPGSILFRSAVLIVPRYEDALLFMVVTRSDRARERAPSFSRSRSSSPPLFLLLSTKRDVCTVSKIARRLNVPS